MFSPAPLTKTDFALLAAALAAVLLSGFAMEKLVQPYRVLADTSPIASASLVSQNAIAPQASPSMPAVAAADPCPISLELMDEGRAFVGGILVAPCLPSQDLVIAHAGLVYSAQTMATGSLLFSLPALKSPAQVDVRFSSGEVATASVDIADMAGVQRVAVQWPFADGFDLHAFENGAEFGADGHIWKDAPATPNVADVAQSGYLTQLGDPDVDMPLMAQVFTYDATATTDLMLEASVTSTGCAQELMGDVLFAAGGAVEKAEVIMAMPECDAVGQFVQMGNISPPINLALAQ
jgi:hypothetical protein